MATAAPLTEAEALAQIREDLGLGDVEDDPAALVARAAQDLGVPLPGRGLRDTVPLPAL